MTRFKIGDLVSLRDPLIKWYYGGEIFFLIDPKVAKIIGMRTVIDDFSVFPGGVNIVYEDYAIEVEGWYKGHTCGGLLKSTSGYWVEEKGLQLEKETTYSLDVESEDNWE